MTLILKTGWLVRLYHWDSGWDVILFILLDHKELWLNPVRLVLHCITFQNNRLILTMILHSFNHPTGSGSDREVRVAPRPGGGILGPELWVGVDRGLLQIPGGQRPENSNQWEYNSFSSCAPGSLRQAVSREMNVRFAALWYQYWWVRGYQYSILLHGGGCYLTVWLYLSWGSRCSGSRHICGCRGKGLQTGQSWRELCTSCGCHIWNG